MQRLPRSPPDAPAPEEQTQHRPRCPTNAAAPEKRKTSFAGKPAKLLPRHRINPTFRADTYRRSTPPALDRRSRSRKAALSSCFG